MITTAPSTPDAAAPCLRVGMPELCRAGLSETWLWKAAGHHHWLALADAHGLDRPDFRDADGARLYAAFTGIALEDAALDTVHEHDALRFDVALSRTGHSRFRSVVTLLADHGPVARMTLDSAFLRRAEAGRNRSAVRGLVARPCRLLPPPDPLPPVRARTWDRGGPFGGGERVELARLVLDPNPHEDFNGADFLYFVSFAAILDRAESAWFRRHDPPLTSRSRRIAYLGNVELGDCVTAILCGRSEDASGLTHWIELRRTADDVLIALARTTRAASGRWAES